MKFRFVHAADLHLDTPFSGVGRTDAAVATALRDASLDAWDDLVSCTLRERAVLLVLAGDIYDGPDRGLRPQMRLLSGLRRLVEQGVRVVMVHGNHDPRGTGWSAVRDWPAGVTICPSDGVASTVVERDGHRLATVYGVSHARADEGRNLARLLRRGPEPGLHLGVVHCSVGADPEHAAYAPCSLEDLRAGGMDYWALGHVHRRRTLLAGDPCYACYPGNLQGRSLSPGERGAKGALVVECDDAHGVIAPPRFVPLDRVRFVPLELDAADWPDVAAATQGVLAALTALRAAPEHEGRGLVVRVFLRGVPAADPAWQAAAADLRTQVLEGVAGWTPFVWCESVRLGLRVVLDRAAIAGRGDFAAELVAHATALAADPAALEALLAEIDAGLPAGIAAVAREVAPSVASPAALVEEAEAHCLRLLLAEGVAP